MNRDEIEKKIADLQMGIGELQQKILINRGAIIAYQEVLASMDAAAAELPKVVPAEE